MKEGLRIREIYAVQRDGSFFVDAKIRSAPCQLQAARVKLMQTATDNLLLPHGILLVAAKK
jgi:hypothetical protein